LPRRLFGVDSPCRPGTSTNGTETKRRPTVRGNSRGTGLSTPLNRTAERFFTLRTIEAPPTRMPLLHKKSKGEGEQEQINNSLLSTPLLPWQWDIIPLYMSHFSKARTFCPIAAWQTCPASPRGGFASEYLHPAVQVGIIAIRLDGRRGRFFRSALVRELDKRVSK
jgi:hypothetical protein